MGGRDRVTEYAQSVVDGTSGEQVGELHRLACRRHLRDIGRQGDPDFPYVWSVGESERAIDFAETLTIGEGFEKRGLRLLPCQAFDRGLTYGWVHRATGYRRFRRRYLCMGRQNGKTMNNGIDGVYIAGGFSGHAYHGGRLSTVATRKRQARLAWEDMERFIQSDPDLVWDRWENPDGRFKVMDYKSEIKCMTTDCTITALSQESGLQDGFRNLYSSIDEVHQHKDNRIYKAIYNGTRALPETLVSIITTRGDNLNSFAKEMDDYCVKILRGEATAEDFMVDIYALDPDDDPFAEDAAERCWGKANPYLITNPDMVAVLAQDAQTAKDMGGADLRDFLIKSMNMWVENTDDSYIDSEKWAACASDTTIEDMRGRECWAGLDLSSGGDLTSLSLEFPLDDGSMYVWSHSWMPRGRLSEHIETDLAPYDLWVQQGLVTVTGGEADYKNDYSMLVRELDRMRREYDLKVCGIGVDPHNFDGMREQIEALGIPVVVITQSAKSLNDATSDIQLLVKSGKVIYDRANELLTWSMLNARVVRNSFDEMKIDKKPRQSTKRIDPIDALVDAHSCRLRCKAEEPVDVSSELDGYLKAMGWK